jgi:hypothetical protein
MTGQRNRMMTLGGVIVSAAFGILACCLTTSCEEGGSQFLSVSPSSATVGANIKSFTLVVVGGTRDLSLPLAWSVANADLGNIVQSSGYSAVYGRTALNGMNTVTVRDQYGAEGVVAVKQVAESTAQPGASPSTNSPAATTPTPSPSFPGQLTVASGEPAFTVSGTTVALEMSNVQYNDLSQVVSFDFSLNAGSVYTGRVFNIQRDGSGETVSYEATINGQAYHYP